MKRNLSVGVGLRNVHFPYIENESNHLQVDFFEIISENFINTRGRPFQILMKLREKYPICMHGVSLSIAAISELDFSYIENLKELIRIVDPFLVSDHLAFTGIAKANLHNLLPFSYDQSNLKRVAKKIITLQDKMERAFLFENLSAYFTLATSEMSEAEFLNELCLLTGCRILLDVNNLYVNSVNQHFTADDYLSKIDFRFVDQLHLAGFTDYGDYLFDTHSQPVHPPVWEIYKKVIKKKNNLPVLIEWDENIPSFEILEQEAIKAKDLGQDIRNG